MSNVKIQISISYTLYSALLFTRYSCVFNFHANYLSCSQVKAKSGLSLFAADDDDDDLFVAMNKPLVSTGTKVMFLFDFT